MPSTFSQSDVSALARGTAIRPEAECARKTPATMTVMVVLATKALPAVAHSSLSLLPSNLTTSQPDGRFAGAVM